MTTMNQTKSKLERALAYAKSGLPVFPVEPNGKKPLTPRGFKDASAEIEQIERWWTDHPDANIAAPTGPRTGRYVVDVDVKNNAGGRESFKQIEDLLVPTLIARTPTGGRHLYYREAAPLKSLVGLLPGIDTRCEGGYVLLPGSTIGGKDYTWIDPEHEVAALPEAFKKFLAGGPRKGGRSAQKTIPEGQRNSALFRLACRLNENGLEASAIVAALQKHNLARCKPPLDLDEIEQIAKSAASQEVLKPAKEKNSAARLVEMAIKQCELSHDAYGVAFARIRVKEHWETWPVRSSQFRGWLYKLVWDAERSAPGSEMILAATNILSAAACFDGPENSLSVRVARRGGKLYYDLTRPDWSIVEIDGNGWRIISDPPSIFRRHSHQQPQAIPLSGGRLETVLLFVNIKDPGQQLLFMVVLVTCLIPDIPHPIPVIHGEHGAAKTSASEVMQALLDPSSMNNCSFPANEQQLAQQLDHRWYSSFDNISRISAEQSDALCRASTGGSFSKRRLFTDDEDVFFNIFRCVSVNGINVVATQPDLLDRAILFPLEPIAPGKRRSKAEFREEFEKERPAILGAMFDALALAIKLLPEFKTEDFRMADFARWGCAITKALGRNPKEFQTAYQKNIHSHIEEALNSNPVAAILVRFMRDKESWQGSASDLLIEVDALASEMNISPRNRPHAPNSLARRINEVKKNLREVGINIETKTRDNTRGFIITKSVKVRADGSDDIDGVNLNSKVPEPVRSTPTRKASPALGTPSSSKVVETVGIVGMHSNPPAPKTTPFPNESFDDIRREVKTWPAGMASVFAFEVGINKTVGESVDTYDYKNAVRASFQRLRQNLTDLSPHEKEILAEVETWPDDRRAEFNRCRDLCDWWNQGDHAKSINFAYSKVRPKKVLWP